MECTPPEEKRESEIETEEKSETVRTERQTRQRVHQRGAMRESEIVARKTVRVREMREREREQRERERETAQKERERKNREREEERERARTNFPIFENSPRVRKSIKITSPTLKANIKRKTRLETFNVKREIEFDFIADCIKKKIYFVSNLFYPKKNTLK